MTKLKILHDFSTLSRRLIFYPKKVNNLLTKTYIDTSLNYSFPLKIEEQNTLQQNHLTRAWHRCGYTGLHNLLFSNLRDKNKFS